MEYLCVLVIEKKNQNPILVSSASFTQLSKFKEKLDRQIHRNENIVRTSIVSMIDLEEFLSVEEILKERD